VSKRIVQRRGSGASNALLSLGPAECEDKGTAGDRAAKRGRDPKGQASLDRAVDIFREGLPRLPVALQMGKVTRGLPKIEPSRFIISMIVSREPAGPAGLPFMQAPNWR
jgi:hypothetical protein